ncbi:MAG: hypothetical protein K8S23_02030 [Candidatus Cloacimonetes bacterium]|nr:hypothetical protein [Candidatus Cloacimonadota bacterium]
MSSEYLYLIIAILLFVNFINLKNNLQMSMFDSVMQSEEYYNALALAEKTVDQAWLTPFSQLSSTFNNQSVTETWDGVTFQVDTTVTGFSYRGLNKYLTFTVEVRNTDYNVYVKLEKIFSDLK